MYSFTKREQIVILVIAFIIIFSLFFKFVVLDKVNIKKDEIEIISKDEQLEGLVEVKELEDNKEQEISEDTIIMVHISGQVYNPGIVELKIGERLKDAIEYSGGLKKEADIDKINLAKKLSDEDKIYIPKVGEETENIQDMSIENFQNTKAESTGKVNINNCTKELLISLPGIGEVTSEKIINYRNENKFNTIEDIKKVSGIGEKKFDEIKDLIIVK